MGSISSFVKDRAFELLFLVAASSALFSTFTFGFHVEDSLRHNWLLIIGWTFLLMVFFILSSYSLRNLVIGSAGICVAGVGAMAVVSASSGFSLLDDAYGNLGFFLLIGFATAALSYLGTRRKGLAVAFLVVGAISCAFVQFLYLNNLVVQLLVYCIAAVALYVLAAQRAGIRIEEGAFQHLSVLGTGAVLCLIAALCACAVFFLVIVPLNPPAQELKIITKYYALEEVHVSGLEEIEHKEDVDKKSDQTKDGQDETNRMNEEAEEIKGDHSTDDEAGNNGDGATTSQGISITGFDQETGALRYFIEIPYWTIALIALLLVFALAVGLKEFLRRRRFKKMRSLPPQQALPAFYFFFVKRFARFGIEKPAALTLIEHASQNASLYMPFEEGVEGATYYQLADQYCRCVYGGQSPDLAAVDACERLYRAFYRNACKSMGRIRYFFTKFWII